MEKVKTIDLLKEGTLLPPAKGKCQECARDHEAQYPHDCQSLFYQMHFHKQHDRWPTWTDAMAHCTEEIKNFWIEQLRKHGVKI